jgi:hypothetical protein
LWSLDSFNFFGHGPIKLADCKKQKSWAYEAPPLNWISTIYLICKSRIDSFLLLCLTTSLYQFNWTTSRLRTWNVNVIVQKIFRTTSQPHYLTKYWCRTRQKLERCAKWEHVEFSFHSLQ